MLVILPNENRRSLRKIHKHTFLTPLLRNLSKRGGGLFRSEKYAKEKCSICLDEFRLDVLKIPRYLYSLYDQFRIPSTNSYRWFMFSCVPEFAFTQSWLLRFAFFIGLNSMKVSVHLLNYIRVYFPLILFCYIIFASA